MTTKMEIIDGKSSVADLQVLDLDKAPWQDLLRTAGEALAFSPPLYLKSFFGPIESRLPPFPRFSEYNILNPWRLPTTLRYVLDLCVPAWARTSPDWARAVLPPFLNRRFWRPTTFFRQPDIYGGVSSFPDEHWFLINGIATNEDMAKINAEYLAHLFHRPLTVIQNASGSLLLDLLECAIGKGFRTSPITSKPHTMTEPTWWAVPAILSALNAPQTRRVVLIAHSQGTIITSNVLKAVSHAVQSDPAACRDRRPEWHPYVNDLMGLPNGAQNMTQKIQRDNLAHELNVLTRNADHDDVEAAVLEKIKKLEIYTFANCADSMRHVCTDPDDGVRYPYLEHFANEFDLVARLGVLAPNRNEPDSLITIDGPVFERRGPGAWGHFLNAHYLDAIDQYRYGNDSAGRPFPEDNPYPRRDPTTPEERREEPRLYKYLHGKGP